MTVNKVSFTNYRNIESADVEFSPAVNVLWGMNAQGKSNILEGIYYFARGRSFRGAKDRELIKFDSDFAHSIIEITRTDAKHTVTLESLIQKNAKKKLIRNGAVFTSVAEMLGNFRAVMFCPAHLSIVTGGPSDRRAFLDIAISQLFSSYIQSLSEYKSALAQRNALLKRRASGLCISVEEWEVYALQLSHSAAEIAEFRNDYCKKLSDSVSVFFENMTNGRETPSLRYYSHMTRDDLSSFQEDEQKEASDDCGFDKAAAQKRLYDKLTSNIDRECAVGSTLWGIHKDDIKISINGKDARLFASQGQQRSLALAMKLSEGEISKSITGEYPVFLLDDVFSELDISRRKYIMDKLEGRQIIVTSCEPSVVPNAMSNSSNVSFMEVSGGKVTQTG